MRSAERENYRAGAETSETKSLSLTMVCMTLHKPQASQPAAYLWEHFLARTYLWAVRHDVDDKLARYPTLAVLCVAC